MLLGVSVLLPCTSGSHQSLQAHAAVFIICVYLLLHKTLVLSHLCPVNVIQCAVCSCYHNMYLYPDIFSTAQHIKAEAGHQQ